MVTHDMSCCFHRRLSAILKARSKTVQVLLPMRTWAIRVSRKTADRLRSVYEKGSVLSREAEKLLLLSQPVAARFGILGGSARTPLLSLWHPCSAVCINAPEMFMCFPAAMRRELMLARRFFFCSSLHNAVPRMIPAHFREVVSIGSEIKSAAL